MKKNMKWKKAMAFGLTAILLLTAAGCSGGAGSNKIIIGGIAPLTGDVATYGVAASNGAELYFSEVKQVLGKDIEFIKQDDKGDPTEAVNAYKKLVENNKAIAILGAVTSSPTAAVAQASQTTGKGTPIMSPTATALDVTTYGPNIFRTCFIDPFQGQIMATYALTKMNVKNAAVIYNNGIDYSIGLAESFKATFTAGGGAIVADEQYADGDKDFKSQLTKIASANPDVIFVPDYYGVISLISKQIKDAGITATLLGADGWDGVLDVVDDPSVVEGAIFCNNYSNDDPDPLVQDFITKYKAKYNETPNGFAALGYDAAKLLVNAIEKAGSTDKEKVVEALQNTDIDALTGHIKYDENRNPIKGAVIIEVKGGKYTMREKLNP